MKFLDINKKKKSIWTRDLLGDTRIGRVIAPFAILVPVGFFLYQGARGIFFKEALAVGKYGSRYTYTGESAQFLGIAYMCLAVSVCVGLFIGPFVRDEKIMKWMNAYVLVLMGMFFVTLITAFIKESF